MISTHSPIVRDPFMLDKYHSALERLKSAGWIVRFQASQQVLPNIIENRFAWVPAEIKDVIKELEKAVSPDEKAWLLGMPDFKAAGSAAFKWNEWERMSLDAAKGNPSLTVAIRRFWDLHFPVAHSVKSGYAYFAIRKEDLSVVCGEEPEFEEAIVVAPSFLELIHSFQGPDTRLSRWV